LTLKWKTYGLIIIVSLLASIVLYNLVLRDYVPKIDVVDKIKYTSDDKYSSALFYDLNHDGKKERLDFHNGSDDKSIFSLVILNNKEKIVTQYNFKCSRMWQKWTAYIDLNADSTDEIIPFYERNDTIFCSIINWKNDEFLATDLFVMAKPDTIYADVWAPWLSFVGNKINTLGEHEVILSITNGFSLNPRGIFTFNFTQKCITQKFFIGGAIANVNLFDLNNNGIDEIIISTNAPANNDRLPKMPHYTDFKAWLIVLDQNYDTLFTKNIDSVFSGIQTCFLTGREENYLISNFGAQNSCVLDKIDEHGEIVSSYDFQKGVSGIFRSQYYLDSENFIYPIAKTLCVFNSNLKLLKQIEFNSLIYITFPFKIGDADQYLVVHANNITILDESYSTIATVNEKIYFDVFSTISSTVTEKGVEFAINNTHGENLFFTLNPNPLYSYRHLLFIGIFIAVFLIELLLNHLASYLLVVMNVIKYSIQKSNKGIVIVTSKRKYLFANLSAKSILSINGNSTVEKEDMGQLISEHISLSNYFNSTFSSQKENLSDVYLSNNKIIKVHILPIKSPLGVLLAFYIQLDDLSEDLLKDRAKTLAHSILKVAHEIKTPLSSVLLSLDSLEDNLNNAGDKQSTADDFLVARNEINRIKKFINNFLKFANMTEPQIEESSLNEIINGALLKFSIYISKGMLIDINIDDKIIVLADTYQIGEVFQVLIENSIDALHGKGRIKINTINENDKCVKVTISDNGEGINEDQLHSIFQPYMTTKKDGTGMGLAIAKKILEDHGSKFEVKSEVGKGTEFSFSLKTI